MSSNQTNKQSMYNTTKEMVKEISTQIKVEFDEEAVDLIAELVYKTTQMYAKDLEAFHKHAKRSTINAEDIRLLVRRNESLKEIVDKKIQQIAQDNPAEEETRPKRKRKATSSTS